MQKSLFQEYFGANIGPWKEGAIVGNNVAIEK